MKIDKHDLIPEVSLFPTDVLKEAHEEIKADLKASADQIKKDMKSGLDSLLLKKGDWDTITWIAPPFVGISTKSFGRGSDREKYEVGIVVLANKICAVTISATHLEEMLSFDAFISKGKIKVGYDAVKKDIYYDGTICYRKIATMNWRCLTTGRKTLIKL